MHICGTRGWWLTQPMTITACRCSTIWNSKAITRQSAHHKVQHVAFVQCILNYLHISLYIRLGHIQIGWPGLTWVKNNGLSCRTVFSEHQLINQNIKSSSWEAIVFSPHSCRNVFLLLIILNTVKNWLTMKHVKLSAPRILHMSHNSHVLAWIKHEYSLSIYYSSKQFHCDWDLMICTCTQHITIHLNYSASKKKVPK